MNDKTSVIFNNPIDKKTIKQANKSKQKYLKKFGDDSKKEYHISLTPIKTLDYINAKNIVLSDKKEELPKNSLVVGNIRMGFGHYRISIAIASCAASLGYTPLWFDLASFDATGAKMIRHQNDLYSKASRISQKSKLFNKLFWEPLNRDGFKKITYNAKDQKNSELLVPLFRDFPKNIPYIATHVWPSQGAIHAGLNNVCNAIPDNWPMALHLSEGAMHAVQTPYAYFGYKTLNGFSKKRLNPIPDKDIKITGNFVDHELLVNLDEDNRLRKLRLKENKPIRILMTIGGAGAGFDMFYAMIKHLEGYVKKGMVTIFINFGDHLKVYQKLVDKHKALETHNYFNEYQKLKDLIKDIYYNDLESGIYAIYNENIFEAVYSTNLLMPVCDLLITKPSELAYYPIPKLFMRHIGGHEVYGAINGREYGDAIEECDTSEKINHMLDLIIHDKDIIANICDRIDILKKNGHYDGGYECVKLVTKREKE